MPWYFRAALDSLLDLVQDPHLIGILGVRKVLRRKIDLVIRCAILLELSELVEEVELFFDTVSQVARLLLTRRRDLP